MKTLLSLLCFLLLGACVDRLQYDIKKDMSYSVYVDGFISNMPGPYHVYLNRSFDIESKEATKTPVSAKHVILTDDKGLREELTEVSAGSYATRAEGMQGRVGGAYTLRIEFEDGRVYESIPDTLLAPGTVDSVFYTFTMNEDFASDYSNSKYGFDVFVNTSRAEAAHNRFMWYSVSTFQSETNPSPDSRACNALDGVCNFYPICSGIRNVGSSSNPRYVRVAPCECCTCWYSMYNNIVILSDDYYSQPAEVRGVKINRIPLSPWIFLHKVHVEVSLRSLSRNTFRFWKAVRDQEAAIGSLFQPITGHIPQNFRQMAGDDSPLLGLFFAAGVASRSVYITREDIPDPNLIPPFPTQAVQGPDPSTFSCLQLYPHATNVKPEFWTD